MPGVIAQRVRRAAAIAGTSGLLLLLAGCATPSAPAYSVGAALLHHRPVSPGAALTNSLPTEYQDHVVGAFVAPGSVQGVIAITPSGCAVGTLVAHRSASVTAAFATRNSAAVAAVPQVFASSKLGRSAAVGMRNGTVSVTLYCGLSGVGVVVNRPPTGLTVSGAVLPVGDSAQKDQTDLRVDG